MPDQLSYMHKGLLGEKEDDLKELRLRIIRLIDDLRMYSFYEDATQPENVNAEAAFQAAKELKDEKERAKNLKEEIKGLRLKLGMDQ